MKIIVKRIERYVRIVTIYRKKYIKNEKSIMFQKSNNDPEKPKIVNVPEKLNNVNKVIVSTYGNHRHIVIGPSGVGKTY